MSDEKPVGKVSGRPALGRRQFVVALGGSAVMLALAACGGAAAPAASVAGASGASSPSPVGASSASSPAAGSVSAAASPPVASASASSGASVAASGAPASAAGSAAPKDVLKLRLGLGLSPAPALPEGTLWLAKDIGYYQNEGLDVDLVEVQAQTSTLTAMRGGDIDLGNVSPSDVLKLTADGTLPMRAINSADASDHFLIASQTAIPSLQGLKGKNYAISRLGGYDHQETVHVLESNGMKATDVNFVAVGAPNDRVKALIGGRVDATTTSIGTWVTIKDQKSLKLLVDEDTFFKGSPLVSKVNAATTKVLQDKAEQLRRFTAALIKASRLFASNKQAWVDAMGKRRTDIKADELNYLWDGFKGSWAVNGLINLAEYQKTAETLYTGPDFKNTKKIDVAAWTDTQFVDGVLKQLGVDPNGGDDPGRKIA